MARSALAFSLLLIVAISAFAHAECRLAEPQKSSSGFYLPVDPITLSGQLSMQVYVQKNGETPCTMTMELARASGYAVSASPSEINFNTSYAMYYPVITATTQAPAAPQTINVRFLDKDTGTELATATVNIAEAGSVPSAKPHTCTKNDTSGCSANELLALDLEPSIIEENISDVYLLVGIIAGFGLIVLIFFVIIPRK